MTKRPSNSRVQHGEPSCADYGCTREECLEARRYKQKRNKLLRDTGRPGMVSPVRSAAHIARFRAAGLQDKDIIQTMGLARNTFYRVVRGLPLTRQVEQRILSVPVPTPSGQVTTLATVHCTGTHRRLQALLVQGWPLGELERRLGVHAGWISRSFRARRAVTMPVEIRVVALYDRLWNVPAERAGIDPGAARAAREIAASAGCAGPLSWDDETIDDPAAVPVVDAVKPVATEGENVAARWLMGESVILDRKARQEVLQHLFEWTDGTKDEIAARLEMTPEAAERAWHRLQVKEAADGRRLWRRVWEYRDKNLTRTSMGEAA